jgi:hypothetical protein
VLPHRVNENSPARKKRPIRILYLDGANIFI